MGAHHPQRVTSPEAAVEASGCVDAPERRTWHAGSHSRTIYTIDASDEGDPVAVHPGGLQFVAGWQPFGKDN